MIRVMLLGVLFLGLGCKNTVGPLDNRRRPAPDPLLPIEEQKRYGAERYSIPEDNPNITPPGMFSRHSPSGR